MCYWPSHLHLNKDLVPPKTTESHDNENPNYSVLMVILAMPCHAMPQKTRHTEEIHPKLILPAMSYRLGSTFDIDSDSQLLFVFRFDIKNLETDGNPTIRPCHASLFLAHIKHQSISNTKGKEEKKRQCSGRRF